MIGIDEVQFLTNRLWHLRALANLAQSHRGRPDPDYKGVPFEPVPQLMAVAEYVTKTLAVCHRCGAPASRTQRIVRSEERIVVGALNAYEARCRRCFEPDLPNQLTMDLKET